MTTLIVINIVGNLNLPNYNQRYKKYRNISIDLLIVFSYYAKNAQIFVCSEIRARFSVWADGGAGSRDASV